MIWRYALLVAPTLVTPVCDIRGQDTTRARTAVVLRVDNDLIALRGGGPPPDYDYTHGTRLSLSVPNGSVTVAQEIYTPRHNTAQPVPGDRPYGAWLYGGLSLWNPHRVRLDSVALRLGVTGESALGEQLQNGVHRLLHNRLESGWSHQLPTRLAAALSYDARQPLAASSLGASRLLTVDAGATLGTLQRALHTGAEAYWSTGRVGAPSAAAPLVRRPGRWHLAAGYHEAFVVHDTFIEGEKGVPGGTRVPWVGEAFLSGGVRLRNWSVDYRYVWRGREYRAESGGHAYGSLTVARLLH